MKKIYLLFVFSILALVVTATNKTWNFSVDGNVVQDNSVVPLTNPYVWNELELAPNFRVSASTKDDPRPEIEGGYGTYGNRLRLNGFATVPTPPTIPTTNYFAFNVDGNAIITLLSVNQGASPIVVRFVNSLGTQIGTLTGTVLSGSTTTTEVLSFNYVGPATKITAYSTYADAAVYMGIYAIEVRPYTPTLIVDKKAAVSLLKAANQIINTAAETVEIYTILGAKVLGSSETAIDITGLASGVYIAKTATGSMKFVK